MTLAFRLEAALVRAVFALMTRLGPARASNLGGLIARMIGPRLPVSRVAKINLRMAMPELDTKTHRRIVRECWENFGRTLAEMPHVPDLRRTASGPGWEIDAASEAEAQALAARGGPLILFSGHIGNWEMLSAAAAHYGIYLSSAYRAPDNPLVSEMMTELRHRIVGAEIAMFPKGARGARGALAHLARGGALGLLMDQKMNDGIAVELFGRPAMTAPALAAFALRFRCPALGAFARRIGPSRFRITCGKPLPLPETGDRQADIATLTRTMNAELERFIRAWPEGWLWLHRRWPKELYR